MVWKMWKLFIERREFFLNLLWEHLSISLNVIVIAIVFGGLIGIGISQHRKLAKPILTAINFLYTIPSISMLGFLIPFSGVGNTTAVIALCIYALLPMVRNTYTAILHVDPNMIEAAAGMGSTQVQILWRIQIPLAMPVIMSGIRSMTTMTIALAGIASFIGAGGLGVAIYRGITTNNTEMTMIGSLAIAMLAFLVDGILGLFERRRKRVEAREQTEKKMKKSLVKILVLVVAGSGILCGLLFGTARKEVIHIATKPMTEQYILGEMLRQLIEQDTDLEVELTQGVGGGVANIQPAMEAGEFDMYPEYTGTGWNVVLKRNGLYTEDQFPALQEAYCENLDMQWTGMYGFNNTYGVVVRRDVAEKYKLRTYSDLAKVAEKLRFGAEYDFFEREDGYEAFCSRYGLQFGETMDMDIGLKYQALKQQEVDVLLVFTTDGQLAEADAVLLKDDRTLFPSYQCGNVVRKEVLKAHPELNKVMEKLTGVLTNQDMAQLNHEVETQGKDPADVAAGFLKKQGLLKQGV